MLSALALTRAKAAWLKGSSSARISPADVGDDSNDDTGSGLELAPGEKRRQEGWFQRLDEMIYVVVRRARMQAKLKEMITLQLENASLDSDCVVDMDSNSTIVVKESLNQLRSMAGPALLSRTSADGADFLQSNLEKAGQSSLGLEGRAIDWPGVLGSSEGESLWFVANMLDRLSEMAPEDCGIDSAHDLIRLQLTCEGVEWHTAARHLTYAIRVQQDYLRYTAEKYEKLVYEFAVACDKSAGWGQISEWGEKLEVQRMGEHSSLADPSVTLAETRHTSVASHRQYSRNIKMRPAYAVNKLKAAQTVFNAVQVTALTDLSISES